MLNASVVGELVSRESIGADTFLVKRRRKYVYHNGFPFLLDRKRNHNEYYHCVKNVTEACKARLVMKCDATEAHVQITQIRQHNHADNGGNWRR